MTSVTRVSHTFVSGVDGPGPWANEGKGKPGRKDNGKARVERPTQRLVDLRTALEKRVRVVEFSAEDVLSRRLTVWIFIGHWTPGRLIHLVVSTSEAVVWLGKRLAIITLDTDATIRGEYVKPC